MAEKQIEIVIKATDLSAKELESARKRLAGIKTDSDAASGGFGGMVKALGPIGPALAAAFSFGAIKSLVSDIMDTADGLVKMSDKTGIGIEALQQLDAAANQGGNTLDQVTAAINKMQVNLAGEDKGAVKALGALGLSLDDLRAMKPEEQFATIGAAIAKVHDPADQAKLRVLLFGRAGNEIAGTLNQDMGAIKDSVIAMSDETVRRLDSAGDTLGQYTKNIKAQIAMWLVDTVDFVRGASDAVIEGLMGLEVLTKRHIASMYESVAKINIIPGVGAKLSEAAKYWNDSAKEAEQALGIFIKKTDDYNASVKAAADATKPAGKAVLDLGEEAKKTAPKLTEAEKAAKAWTEGIKQASEKMVWLTTSTLPGMNAGYSQLAPNIEASGASMIEAARAANEWEDGIDGLTTSFAGLNIPLPATVKQSKEFTEAMKEHAPFWKEHSKGLGQVADSMGLMSRASEMAGHKTTASLLTIAQTGVQAFAQGGPWAAAIATATAALAAFGDKLFKTEGKKVNDMRDEFVAAAGGLHELNVKAHEAGLTLDRLLRAKTVAEYEAAVKELNAAFDAQNAKLAEQAALRKELEASIDATTKEAAALRDQLIPTWDDVSAAIDEYGLSLDGAGTKVQQLKLMSDTTKIINDWEMLQRAGWDTNGLLDGMQDELSKMTQEAIKYGAELPAQMKPILQSLADQGKLVDANGNQLKDLTGIKFGAPIESEADKINKAIQGLVDKLADLVEQLGKLPGVAASVSTDLQAELGTAPWEDWPTPVWPDGSGYGGYGGKPADMPGHAAGGVFSRPHAAWIAEGGEPEMVGSRRFMAEVLADALRAVSGPAAVAAPAATSSAIRIYLDGRELTGSVARHLPDVLASQGVR